MKTILHIVISTIYLYFSESTVAQEKESIVLQKGVELSWSNNTIVFYSKEIEDNEQVKTKFVVLNLSSGDSVTLPHSSRIVSALAFNEFIITVTIDGEIKGFSKSGKSIETLSHRSAGEGYLAACKLSDDGIFVVLSLLPLDEKRTKNYQLDFIKVSDDKSYIFKRIIPGTPIGYGNLVYRQERLWLLEKARATQIDFSNIDFSIR